MTSSLLATVMYRPLLSGGVSGWMLGEPSTLRSGGGKLWWVRLLLETAMLYSEFEVFLEQAMPDRCRPVSPLQTYATAVCACASGKYTLKLN